MASADQLFDIIEPVAPLVDSFWAGITIWWLPVSVLLLVLLFIYRQSLLSDWRWRIGLYNISQACRKDKLSQRKLAFAMSNLLCRRYQLAFLYSECSPDTVSRDEWCRCVRQLNQLKYSNTQAQLEFDQLLSMVRCWR